MREVTSALIVFGALLYIFNTPVSGRSTQDVSEYEEADDDSADSDLAVMFKRYYNGDGYRQFNSVQRRHLISNRDWCARWGEQCVPESRARFALCCDGLRCVCGTLWHSSDRCQCKKASVFGR